jgi:hypothetical protein
LDRIGDGQGGGDQPLLGAAHLEGARASAASDERIQALQRAPHVLLRAIAISDDRLQAHPIGWRNGDGNSFTHHRPSHETRRSETLFGLFG